MAPNRLRDLDAPLHHTHEGRRRARESQHQAKVQQISLSSPNTVPTRPDARGVPSTPHLNQGVSQFYLINDRLTWSCQFGSNVSARVRRVLSFISRYERRDCNAVPRHPPKTLLAPDPLVGGRCRKGQGVIVKFTKMAFGAYGGVI